MNHEACRICAELDENAGQPGTLEARLRHLTELVREVLRRLPERKKAGA